MDTRTDSVALFKAALADFAAEVRRWFLPHLAGGLGLFLLVSYVTATTLFANWPSGIKWLCVWLVFVIYGSVAFIYVLFTTCVFALRLACVHWNDFIESILDLVQTAVAVQLSDMNTGLSKAQARSLVRGGVHDVFRQFKRENPSSRVLLWVGAGAVAAAVRAVLSAKISKWSSRTVQLTKVFAGRATLAGAVFLNLHFFATVLLSVCYAFGLAVAAVNIYFVFLLK